MNTRERLEMIRDDARNDAATLDGAPMTGLTMGTCFGEVYAMIDALAASMLEIVDRLDRVSLT